MAPDACTLTTAQQPQPVAEFDDLFTTTVVPATGPSQQVQLRIGVPAGRADVLAALGARATAAISS